MQRFIRHALRALGGPLGTLAHRASRRWHLPPSDAEPYTIETPDGWLLGIFRVRRTDRPAKGPVFLQHGLAGSHFTYLFPNRSLAGHLADLGFDCWVSNLRGGANSRRTPAAAPDWDIHDYLDTDIPAILGRIRAETGAERLQWVGHSMGGVLLYLYGIRHGGAHLASGIAAASCLDYKVGSNGFQSMVRYLGLLDWLPSVPLGAVYKLYSPLVGRVLTGFDRFGYYPGNVEPEVVRAYYANVYQNVAPGVMQSLATTFEKDGFRDRLGFSYTRRAERFTLPLLALAGEEDRQCGPAAVEATVAALGSHEKAVRVFGRSHGHRSHYGHFDLIVGRNAPEEVWPVISEWLLRHAKSGAQTRQAG
jgi:pimeloyl-ACP methyl ester carboxylesterase